MSGPVISRVADHRDDRGSASALSPSPHHTTAPVSAMGTTPSDVSAAIKTGKPPKRASARARADSFGTDDDPRTGDSFGAPVAIDAALDSNASASDGKLEGRAYAALVEQMSSRYSTEQIAEVSRAYILARDAHSEQKRSSGEPYIVHPIAVAGIVFEMQLDHHAVMAALMHDVLEDTPVSRETLVKAFGEEVTHIVDGVSKLNHLKFRSKKEAQAESFRKMLLAMVTDIRVILIKLADRLHNMRTIGALRPDKRRRIGKETLEVYAPIATRLGMFTIKTELEDLGFRARYPARSRVLEATVAQSHRNREQLIGRVADRITATLSEKGVEATVTGREKHLYSLYNKMLKKQLPFQRVFDILALRVVVDTREECYQALGLIHQMYAPIFSRFKDYIAVPKQNGYQSLHTVLNHGSDGTPIEVQIRTHEMDATAESGIAAHWAYKNEESSASAASETPDWLSRLVDMQDSSSDTVEFVENVKVDLYPGEIYVFTPKGKIIQLPRNATPVDFAYAVHSEVGNKCVSAKIDRRLASLSTPLESGQTVEILTGPRVAPSPMWLNSVMTAKARAAIRQHLRALDKTEAVEFGQRLLRRALTRHDRSLETVPDKAMQALLSERRMNTEEDLFADIGLGLHLPSQIASRLIQLEAGNGDESPQLAAMEPAPLLVDSANSPTLYMSRCCHPIPGDSVQGFFTPGKGVAVHRTSCRNVRRFRRRPKEWVAVDWAPEIKGSFEVVILGHLVNQPGALARVTSTMSLMNVNIEHLEFDSRSEDDVSIRFALSVESRVQLARIVRRLRNLTVVRSVKRDN
ncbi:RelA/SpoT family protein [Granulosicoccus sp. 3-233]|uniref:RelA/SpoT family protein n=1 Tax=Granulosicoccus sp. 3-233 TaxID=3417969 RepID=UPI003D32BAD4